MTDRVVVITGGSRGIGRATAIAAAAPRLSGLHRLCQQRGRRARRRRRHRGQKRQSARGKMRCRKRERYCGAVQGRRYVRNARRADQQRGDRRTDLRVDEMSAERIQRMMAVNVTGSMLCAREAVKRMSTRHGGKGGVIVNLSSVAVKARRAQYLCRLCGVQGRHRFLHDRSWIRSRRRRHSRRCDPARADRYRNSRLAAASPTAPTGSATWCR